MSLPITACNLVLALLHMHLTNVRPLPEMDHTVAVQVVGMVNIP